MIVYLEDAVVTMMRQLRRKIQMSKAVFFHVANLITMKKDLE
jgi:hypothetical protein